MLLVKKSCQDTNMPIYNSILCTGLRTVQTAVYRHCVWLILQVPKGSCLFKLFIISEKILINISAVVIHFHYPSNYFTAYSKTKMHNMYFFGIFLHFFSFQYFLIRSEKNNKTKTKNKTHKKPYSFQDCFFFFLFFPHPKRKPIGIPAFQVDSKCCDLYQLSVVLKKQK